MTSDNPDKPYGMSTEYKGEEFDSSFTHPADTGPYNPNASVSLLIPRHEWNGKRMVPRERSWKDHREEIDRARENHIMSAPVFIPVEKDGVSP